MPQPCNPVTLKPRNLFSIQHNHHGFVFAIHVQFVDLFFQNGVFEIGCDFEQGNEHESAFVQFRVRNFKPFIANDTFSVKKNVDVDGTRPPFVLVFAAFAPEFAFNLADFVEQFARIEGRVGHNDLIQKRFLFGVAPGLRFINMAFFGDFAYVFVDEFGCCAYLALPVAHVAPQSEEDVDVSFCVFWLHVRLFTGAKMRKCVRSVRGVREVRGVRSVMRCLFTFLPLPRNISNNSKFADNMKNLFAVAMCAVVLLLAACGGIDKELVGKMQADVTKVDGLVPGYEALGTKITNITNQMNAVPEAVKTQSSAEYQNILRINTTMTQKYQATMAEMGDIKTKIQALVGDYTAGKIKTEDALKEYETLSTAVQGMTDVLDRMNQRMERIETDYAKMSATWNAKAEEAAQ